MGPPAFWYKVLIHMTVGTTFPRKILNGKEPCEPLMSYEYESPLARYAIQQTRIFFFLKQKESTTNNYLFKGQRIKIDEVK